LQYNGHVAWRNNTVGVLDPTQTVKKIAGLIKSGILNKGTDIAAIIKRLYSVLTYRKGDVNSLGVADIICCLKGGKLLEIEYKSEKDRERAMQLSHAERINKAGGYYIFVRGFDDFVEQYNKIIKEVMK